MRTRDIYTVLGRLAQLDKAPDYGSGDSGFKSQGGHFFFFVRGLHARRWETLGPESGQTM